MSEPEAPPGLPAGVVERFEGARPRLRNVAARLLGPGGDVDDAVQEAFLRLGRSEVGSIDNLEAWLTTVTARVCLNVLRSRGSREEPLDARLPDLVVSTVPPAPGPESELALAESVEEALLVVLDALSPAERVAFVLHDVFAVPFDEIAQVVGRSPASVRQLASRGRRRVQRVSERDEEPGIDPVVRFASEAGDRRAVVDAFFRAARAGELDGLVALLDPDVVLRADAGEGRPGTVVVRGADAVGGRALLFAGPDRVTHPVWIDGDPGVRVAVGGRVVALMRFVVLGDRIVRIDALTDRARLGQPEPGPPKDG